MSLRGALGIKALAALPIAALLLAPPPVSAQGQPSQQPPRAVAHPQRVARAPNIDGLLDERLWNDIEPITDFRQYEPDNGAPASERTEVRLAYDDEFLYVGVRAFDREPGRIVARQFERDARLDNDDAFTIEIDSLDDNRTAVFFETTPAGTQSDGELRESLSSNKQWDTIWYSAGHVDELGYTLEIAIPFFALRFKRADEVTMGLYLERIIRRKNERVSWPGLPRDYNYTNISQFNSMEGLRGIRRGVGVEIKPYAIGGYSEVPRERGWDADAGLDVKWGVTSNLTTDLTANPDFAQVESDALQVNLTRFSLFYPEKRDFFLESADLFAFGLEREAEVFFSRRIGIRQGREVPIVGGARLYGLAGSTNIGVMTMQTRRDGALPGENFSVARVKQNVFERSYVGGIFTSRQGDTAMADTNAGADLRLVFGVNTRIQASLARNARNGVDTGNWFGDVTASTRVDFYDWSVEYTDIGENFDPGIGYVRRPDQKRWLAAAHVKPRPAWKGVRQLSFGGRYERVENHRGELETESFQPGFVMTLKSEDIFTVTYTDDFELVPFPFPIGGGLLIPAGEYRNRQASLRVTTNASRRLALNATHAQGGYYDGTLRSDSLALTFKPVPRIELRSENQIDAVEVPSGSFDSIISRLYASYYFSPSLTTRLALQYSSLFDEMLVNFRVRWIYTPGSEAWLVYDEGRVFTRAQQSLRDRAFIIKVVHNFHF